MEGATFGMGKTRELLCEKIVDVLRSWPEMHRRVFVQSHYKGESAEEISLSIGLKPADVRQILEHCDRKLRTALKAFRFGNAVDGSSESLPPVAFASDRCYQ